MRPIPVDIVPSHVYLSQDDQITLFGSGYAMTVAGNLSCMGQYVCGETVEIFGRLKRGIRLHVLGPNWEHSFAELSLTNASYIGFDLDVNRSGDISDAKPCRIVGPAGEIEIDNGIISPMPHLLCSPKEAEDLRLSNGSIVSAEILLENPKTIDNVIVRVHPTYKLRLELSTDYARDLWITHTVHARIIE
jgi:putative phosphotransacetylase